MKPARNLSEPEMTVLPGSSPVIQVRDLCKTYDGKLVIDHLSFAVHPGVVTGFLGPNGAGKSTTMRLIVGLDRPTSGDAVIGGVRYVELALLGDPRVLILDEPVNGLDPDGIMWIRNLVIHLAGEGRTILISSHLMSEMAATASELIVIGCGRLIAACTTDEFIERSSKRSVFVVSPDAAALTDLLAEAGGHVDVDAEGALIVRLIDAAHIGALASHAGLELHELTPQLASLEDAFMEQTHTSTEFGGHSADGERDPVSASSPGGRS